MVPYMIFTCAWCCATWSSLAFSHTSMGMGWDGAGIIPNVTVAVTSTWCYATSFSLAFSFFGSGKNFGNVKNTFPGGKILFRSAQNLFPHERNIFPEKKKSLRKREKTEKCPKPGGSGKNHSPSIARLHSLIPGVGWGGDITTCVFCCVTKSSVGPHAPLHDLLLRWHVLGWGGVGIIPHVFLALVYT